MTSEMQRVLFRLSTRFDPDPAVIFREVLQTLSQIYGGAMAMINLVAGDRIRYRDVVNLHPGLGGLESIALRDSY